MGLIKAPQNREYQVYGVVKTVAKVRIFKAVAPGEAPLERST